MTTKSFSASSAALLKMIETEHLCLSDCYQKENMHDDEHDFSAPSLWGWEEWEEWLNWYLGVRKDER